MLAEELNDKHKIWQWKVLLCTSDRFHEASYVSVERLKIHIPMGSQVSVEYYQIWARGRVTIYNIRSSIQFRKWRDCSSGGPNDIARKCFMASRCVWGFRTNPCVWLIAQHELSIVPNMPWSQRGESPGWMILVRREGLAKKSLFKVCNGPYGRNSLIYSIMR